MEPPEPHFQYRNNVSGRCDETRNQTQLNKLQQLQNRATRFVAKAQFKGTDHPGGGGTPILGHTRDVRPEWVRFPGRKPADGYKFLTKNLRMGHNFDIILPGNGWFFSKIE